MWPPVKNKQDFVHRYQAGEFGNHAPTWDTASDYLASGYPGLVHIRNRVASGATWYNVSREEFSFQWKSAVQLCSPSLLYISAMAPTEKTILQGETVLTPYGIHLTYTRVAKPMRQALAEESLIARGIIGVTLLRHFLCPNSYEWLQVLLDRYDSHAVEFSTYSVQWGTLPNYNTVFWEVRSY